MWNRLRQWLGINENNETVNSDEVSSNENENRLVRTLSVNDFEVEIDLTTQILGLTVPDETSWQAEETEIIPNLSKFQPKKFISASVLACKAKQFDDGLYAAVELAAQEGLGKYPGKRFLLSGLAQKSANAGLPPNSGIFEILLAAARLGGLPLTPPGTFEEGVKKRVEQFLNDERLSKPLGFYGWTESLKSIFQQDRMLQSEIDNDAGLETIVDILRQDKNLQAAYHEYLDLCSKLTNPLARNDLRSLFNGGAGDNFDQPRSGLCFFPPSKAHETEIIKRLYGDTPIPDGFNLADEMIRMVRAGSLDLTPTDLSGWYDYQTWALEPLIIPEKMPEAARLRMMPTYRDLLLEMFKGIIALTRETHVKQLEMPVATGAAFFHEVKIYIRPELTVEPLAAYYRRRAESYLFIRNALSATFGEEALKEMYRLTPYGPANLNLSEELKNIIAIFHGAYQVVNRELGLSPETSLQGGSIQTTGSDVSFFRTWIENLENDEDLEQDPRMMVPVFYDVVRRKTKVWAFLGWASRPVRIFFEGQPAMKVRDKAGRDRKEDVKLDFVADHQHLIYPVSAEVYVDRILNREEFRQHCDKYKTRTAILENLT